MHCRGILHEICSFLRKTDLVQLRQVSPLFCAVASTFLPELEYQWLVSPVICQLGVELAPPCAVLAMTFLEQQRKLLVCTASVDHGGVVECGFYTHEATAPNESTRRYVELPSIYGSRDSQVRFEGQRFLLCRAVDGALFVFDCALEVQVRIPHGCEDFFASRDGSRLIVLHEGYLHYLEHCSSMLPCYSSSYRASHRGSLLVPFVELRLQRSLLSIPLEMNSLAWNAVSIGRNSALCLRDNTAIAFTEEYDGSKRIVSTWSFERVSFGSWGDDGMCCTYTTALGVDEYVVATVAGEALHFVRPFSKSVLARKLEISSLRPALVQRFDVLQPGSSFALVLLRQQIQEVFLFTTDMSLVRCIRVGKPSAMAILPSEGVMIAAPLPHATLSGHPLLEAVESGVGTAFFFVGDGESLSEAPQGKNDVSGVEVLSWISFGLVSASLMWTASALVYNGWWLHLQLLFCGKMA
ncbi:hypothetical protein DQ04_01371050 [Trypanosoma grayi]|uniref:hypothetical protein n=1 Tax=Trypanosoma grayi TaxID=71804 RepID=UPI0004F446D9|nr:hypothetical protein DQ04_01371050 [Trypanosoma grayi]KEG12858.1 hypothetical protein DQ04_01371050 [Trypanosoma grayi]